MKLKTRCIVITILMTLTFSGKISAQFNSHYLRIARLIIDSTKLEDYKRALKEHAETAVRVEPGVLMLYAVYEKDQPTHVSVFEMYADEQAYQIHIKTAHFLKYKAAVANMVKSLELIDVTPIALEAKKVLN